MQPNQSNQQNSIEANAELKPNTSPKADVLSDSVSYNQLNKMMFKFFKQHGYECYESFKQGYSKSVSEDYDNIDLLCNLNELTYNYCSNKRMSQEEKINYKNMCTGIQMLNKSLKQYQISTTDKIYVANIIGYILKVIRNYYHD